MFTVVLLYIVSFLKCTWTEGSSALLWSRVVRRPSVRPSSLTFHIFYFSWNHWTEFRTEIGLLRGSYFKPEDRQGLNKFYFLGTKIVKHLQRRQHDHESIKTTLSLVSGLSVDMFNFLLKHCYLISKAAGTIRTTLPPQMRQGPELCPLILLVGSPISLGPLIAWSIHWAEHSLLL